MSLTTYIPLCNAMVFLLTPLVEIVIHDLSSNSIVYINGGLSKRNIGDPSLLERDSLETNLEYITYPKLNFDGHLIKSISLPLEKRWLLCINCDVSVFQHMQNLSKQLLHVSQSAQPQSLFKHDWQEKIHSAIHSLLNDNNWHFDILNQKQKKQIVHNLFQQGAFREKKAADYIANTLGMGRATVFNYLRHWRQHESF